MSKKKINFMCTAFRDGFQSIYGARVLTEDFMPAVEAASQAGITYFEAGGGARFQSLYFYCNQDAFTMMDAFRKQAGPDANLQTLARGVNVVGLDSQPSDVIDLHAKLFKKHGITTIRNFDALNDVNNLIFSGQAITKHGLKHQVCVSLMELPPGCTGAHDVEFYQNTLQKIIESGLPFDSVCFKDASGTAVPSKVYQTISMARRILPPETSIHFHTHETAGISIACYLAAIEAGADAIDLSLAPCSGGTSQPDVITMWHALRGSDYTLDINVDKVRQAEEVLKNCMKDYFLPPEATAVEPIIPWSPMPGGALTANTQMLRDNNLMDRYPEIIKAMSDVVKAGGYGTSVTPVSQFYFQQAFNNVMHGPWKKIAPDYGRMVLGYFGKTPVAPDPSVVELARQQLNMDPTTKTPLEIDDANPDKGVEAAVYTLRELDLPVTDENIFIVAACREKGISYLQGKAKTNIRKIGNKTEQKPIRESGNYTVTVNNKPYNLKIDKNSVVLNGKNFNVDIKEGTASCENKSTQTSEQASLSTEKGESTDAQNHEVKATMPGLVLKVAAPLGSLLNEGDTILILEAMKMEMNIPAPVAGELVNLPVEAGDQIMTGDTLAVLN